MVPSLPSFAGPVHGPHEALARQQYEKAEYQHGISKSAFASSDKVFAEQTIVTDQDGTVIAISQTSRSRAPRSYRGMSVGIAGFVFGGLIVLAFLYIGYLFLDAGTRGQFTWTLRIISIVAFFGMCGVVAILRHRM